ncbi:MAG: TonB family protein [Bacteroidales bacterium]
MEENKMTKYSKIALIGTLLFHGVIVGLFLIFGFSTPLPLPAERGVVVNLGYSDQGQGIEQPKKPAESQSSQTSSSTSSDQEDVATQDTEEAPAINESDSESEAKDTDKGNDEQTDETPEEEVDEDLLFPGNQDSEGGSEGNTGETGDQGESDGDPNANRHSGESGGGGDGVDFSLRGRYAKDLPKPINKSQEQGKVVVKIWVDTKGNVINAEPGHKGSTTNDAQLYKLAKQAALRAKFNKKNNAPEEQTGTITYIFIQSQ